MAGYVFVVGRTTQTLKHQYRGDLRFVKFKLATNDNIKGANKKTYIPCIAWQQVSDILVDHTHVGILLEVMGHLDSSEKELYVVIDRVKIHEPKKKSEDDIFNI